MSESTLDCTKSQDGDEDNMTFVLGGEVKWGRIISTQSTISRKCVKGDDTIRSSTTRATRDKR